MSKIILSFLLIFSLSAPLVAQVSTGTIAGTVTDPQGAVVANATVTVTNKMTGLTRVVNTGNDGIYSVASLPAGNYEVKIDATGFATSVTTADVATGQTTTINIPLKVGAKSEVVDIQGAAANIDLESHTVSGVVGRQQIENLPLNGRNFLNLAQLEPGVLVTPANPAQFNAQFSVSILGGPASHTAITVDGGNIRNPVEGGTGQNLSQEVVQEFQLSSTNFDLSTGITAYGAVNIVTRSGGNDFHGAGYFYFRDHNISAYPSLNRNPLTDDPFFARRQGGFWVGGPIKRDKSFFFFNFENTNQSGVYIVVPDLPSVSGFSTIATAPYRGKQFSGRVDYRLNDKHSGFIRYSHDGNRNSGPFGIPVPPSNFVSNKNWSDQSILGITSSFTPNLVNDFRFSYGYWQNRNIPAPCDGDINGNCIGAGGPEVFYLNSVNFALGNNFNSPQGRDLRRYPVSDNISWQRGAHRIKLGGDWEFNRGTGYWGFFDPGRVYLLSPEFLIGVGVPLAAFPLLGLPTKINSAADLAKLPVAAFLLGIGDRAQPAYKFENARPNHRFKLYAQDTWKVTQKFTLNYGLGWEHESNVLNFDLDKPAYLSPLYGSDLSGPKKEWKNFTPILGFAWSVGKDDKTVVRGGVGVFYDTQLGWWRLGERAVIGGSGRQFIGNAAVARLNGQGNFSSAFLNTLGYRYGQFLAELPALRAQQEAKFPGTGDQPQILLSKQANALGAIYPHEFPTTQAQHFNFGVQREWAGGIVTQADFVYRHTIHGTPGGFFGASVDYNKFNSIAGPVIPACTSTAQANDPNAQCSAGPINFWWPGATSTYKALLAKVDKRFSSRYQFTASYAFQNSKSILDITQNLNDFFATYGPDLPKHNLNLSGMADLPWGFQVSLVSAFISRGPIAPTINGFNDAGTDITSGGYSSLLHLLGRDYSGFLSKFELASLVSEYNTIYAGELTPAGASGKIANQRYPFITLPSDFRVGDIFSSQDIRVTKSIKLHERVNLRLIGEVFNAFNVSNLTGFNYALTSPSSFGKPTQRVGQTFGSGGPRAFQFGARLAF
jgi:hypothetical protein